MNGMMETTAATFKVTAWVRHVTTAVPFYDDDEVDLLNVTIPCDDVNQNDNNDLTRPLGIRITLITAYSIVFVAGLALNSAVILAVASNRRLQTARNIFLLNLMISDILLCLTSLPITPTSLFYKRWIFGAHLCSMLPLTQSVAIVVTSWSLTVIALDKFIHIMDSTREAVRLKSAIGITVLLWTVTTTMNIPFFMSMELTSGLVYIDEEHPGGYCGYYCYEAWADPSLKEYYGSMIFAFQFVIPAIIITYCYYRIFSIVRRDMICDNRQFANSLTLTQKMDATRRKRRVNHILVAMVITFIASWAPMTVLNLLNDWKIAPKFTGTYPYITAALTHLLAMTTVVWNPLLFYWLTRQRKTPTIARFLSMNMPYGLASNGALRTALPSSMLTENTPAKEMKRQTQSFTQPRVGGNNRALQSTASYAGPRSRMGATSTLYDGDSTYIKPKTPRLTPHVNGKRRSSSACGMTNGNGELGYGSLNIDVTGDAGVRRRFLDVHSTVPARARQVPTSISIESDLTATSLQTSSNTASPTSKQLVQLVSVHNGTAIFHDRSSVDDTTPHSVHDTTSHNAHDTTILNPPIERHNSSPMKISTSRMRGGFSPTGHSSPDSIAEEETQFTEEIRVESEEKSDEESAKDLLHGI